MRSWVVVSYYTRNTLYVRHSKKLVESLKLYKIPHYVEAIDSLGSWQKNTCYKPTFLKRMLKKFQDLSIVYVDCDAEFKRYPTLFDTLDCDVAVYEFDRQNWSTSCKGTEVLSGTIFLRNNETVSSLIEKWIQECQKSPRVFDQKSLEKILAGNYYRLSGEYCKIFNTMKNVRKPVIVHYQASRTVRRNSGRLT